MFQDLKEAITVTLAKRLASPVLSSFFLSWLIINYDITLLLFSGQSWSVKVQYIQNSFDSTSEIYLNLILPIGTALFYVFLWPFLDMYFYKWSKEMNFKYREIQKNIEDKAPMTRKEERNLRSELRDYQESSREEIANKDVRIGELESRNKELALSNADLTSSNSDIQEKINGLEEELSKIRESGEENKDFDKLENLFKNRFGENFSLRDISEDAFNDLFDREKPEETHKNYIYEFLYSDKLREQASREGYILGEPKLVINKAELPEETWNVFHDAYYSASEVPETGSLTMINVELTRDNALKDNVPFSKAPIAHQPWVLNDIKNVGNELEIINSWASEYAKAKKEILRG